MSFIIHGATGAQGGPLFDLLLSKGEPVFAAVRDPANSQGKPCVTVDNSSVESLVSAYMDANGIFFHLPQAPEPLRIEYARNFLEAIETAKPKRVVISTSGAVIDRPGSTVQVPEDSAMGMLIRGIGSTNTSHAIVAPRLYLENLLLPMVVDGVKQDGVLLYPIRADLPVSWSSHLDIAEVAERLLMDHTVTGIVGVGHMPGMKGPALADGFSERFKKQVQFEAQSPEEFRKLLEPMLGPAAANVAAFYQALSTLDENVIAEDTSAQQLLGLTPRSVGEWLDDVSA
ncbi:MULTISPECIES: NmrA family NAD(P)-binding protein [unclassified Rhizobium]|uniref:NmrA family NAD(P)-binding protein n=1 Tax=unclassified Rhizobium TaxID=2613769 RepID=UPI00177AF349|nr:MULTISPECIES: NAD(P)H-binding protein [unclassified Rhizobium]MBD8688883.1 NAD(P)H-binding protein [Rhizobium sp. CFBP 13644]MBD8694146.1 NAD(P)H-binding protein [Rhizobium sp. CFBP 13717]